MFVFVPVLSEGGEQLYFEDSLIVASWSILPDEAPAPYLQAEYRQALQALFPQGAAWPREQFGDMFLLVDALAAEFARVDLRMAQLLTESNPAQAAELLTDWERVAGLPDPCVTVLQTMLERREAVLSKVTYGGGQSRAFFSALAATLGYAVTIEEFRSAAEAGAAGISFVGSGWAHTWRVGVPEQADVREFRAGSGAAGEPLRTWGNDALECRFQRLKPAHTICLFAYA